MQASSDVVVRVRVLRGALARARGLIGRPPPAAGEAVWLVPCNWVHGFGMRYPVDVVYLDRRGVVLCVHRLLPWRIGPRCAQACSVLELACGEALRVGLVPGVLPRLIEEQAGATKA